jgi:glycosidase
LIFHLQDSPIFFNFVLNYEGTMITQDDIIYFIITDRFYDGDTANNVNINKANPQSLHGGDLKGIQDKFDYLLNLGITAIWITPVYVNFPGQNNKQPYHYYWPKDFTKIDNHLYSNIASYPAGTKKYLKEFVDSCHQRDLKVVLDVVVNHTGYDGGNPIFPPDWYRNDQDPDFSGLPKLNLANPSVIDYFINNLIDWIESSGIDGIRMDMAKSIGSYALDQMNYIIKDPDFNKFWYYYKSIIKGKFPNLFIVGEVLNTSIYDIDENATFQNKSDLNSIFDFPFRDSIKNVIILNQPFTKIARKRLNIGEDKGVLDLDDPYGGGYYSNANRLVTLLDNHDLDKRILSWAREIYPGEGKKSLAYQVTELCYALLLTARGIPQIYYGSEVGLEGWKFKLNPADRNEVDYDLRRDFPWEKINSKNEVQANFPDEKNLFLKIKKLIKIRKGSNALKYGVTITLWVDDLVYAFLRYYYNEIMICIFNNGRDPMQYPMEIPLVRISKKNLQSVPDRIIDLLEKKNLVNVFDSTDKYKVVNSKLSVTLNGKAYKILSL